MKNGKKGITMALAAVALCLTLGGAALAGEEQQNSGTASWFGSPHHGKNTASGEPYDMYAMTAAHRKLPFGTVLKVTNRANGREVVVKVNDRGPFRKKRILDLSYAAAERLGMKASGTANIIMEVVGDIEGRPLIDSQAFFVRLDDMKRPSVAMVKRQMTQLMRVGFQDAPSLLQTAGESMALGPFECFQDAQETLNRVATIHPKASIMLADKNQAKPAASTVAMSRGAEEQTGEYSR